MLKCLDVVWRVALAPEGLAPLGCSERGMAAGVSGIAAGVSRDTAGVSSGVEEAQ